MKKEEKFVFLIFVIFLIPFSVAQTDIWDTNITSPKAYFGYYNWSENSDLLSFDGATLSFDWSQLNNSYTSIYYTKTELDNINNSNNN